MCVSFGCLKSGIGGFLRLVTGFKLQLCKGDVEH